MGSDGHAATGIIRSGPERRIAGMNAQHNPSNTTLARRAAQLAFGIGSVVLLSAAPQLVRADTMATPVDVRAISVTPDAPSTDSPEVGVVRLVFENANTVAAREVIFQVISQSGVVRQQIDDKGTFAPATVIMHTFTVPGAQQEDMVQVAAVKYADGTTWTLPGTHIEGAAQQSVLTTGSAPFGGI
jgi:hypothetical protein